MAIVKLLLFHFKSLRPEQIEVEQTAKKTPEIIKEDTKYLFLNIWLDKLCSNNGLDLPKISGLK